MEGHSPITFRGALGILGHYDRPWLEKINKLAGGVILASGLAPGAAALSALWGWVDQKNEAVALLRDAVDGAAERLPRTGGLERHQLVIAAHTTLVLSAFFDAFAESPLGGLYAEAAVSDREKLLLAGAVEDHVDSFLRQLYGLGVPTPSAAAGFQEMLPRVERWAYELCEGVDWFIREVVEGTDDAIPGVEVEVAERLAASVRDRYNSYYLECAARVPEFAIWADTIEHAATRTAMGRLEQLLAHVAGALPARDLRALVNSVNQAVLGRPVLEVHNDGYGIDGSFPTVEQLFVEPRYRVTAAGTTSRIGDENWWRSVPVVADFPLLVARHLTCADAMSRPLVLLGHPGAGKSLVMKVIAARLSGQYYTVVRVPLRRVDASAAVAEQVQQALDQATHQRVHWADLVDHSAQTVRVVLLDGLDELLQASSTDRADYLHRVADFQTREAALGYPVAVVVTSRTLVIDRLSLPRGIVVVKLEEFDEQRIALWVRKWNQARTDPDLPQMSARWALAHRQLAAQPLLLLMLTLYHSGHGASVVDDLSSTQLYRALFDDYAHREVIKRSGRMRHGSELAEAVQAQLRTLAVAALGMVNRGRQEITEAELSADLTALEQYAPSGERLLGQFFFIHSPEAQDVASRRSYEFLHATFAEYLVAVRVVEELRDVAQAAFARRVRHTPDDDLLFALLSHQPLAVQQPVLGFADDLLASLDHDERHRIRDTLDLLLSHHQARRPSRHFADYRPTTPNTVRALAAYSTNLVLLRIGRTLTGQDTMLADLFAEGDPLTQWRDTLDLWKAGLDDTGFHAMLGAVDLVDGDVLAREGVRSNVPEYRELHLARLRDDRRLLSDLRLAAMMRSRSYLHLRGVPQSKVYE
ncbi:NACHT domain-containing protein [Actinosynnema sp. NPDC023587]|uniref:NACHT domain-containing protein n=1 Tax=Actinosynnema sp. NPDC023587 TaxID=3154695 RepID=UPI0033DADAC4